MKKIVHIITGLGSGGAENMLYKTVKYSDRNLYHHEVISLIDKGVMGEKIEALGIKVHSLNLNIKNLIQSFWDARKICREFDVINTWLYHADIFGFLIAKTLPRKKIIWNVRHSNLDKKANKSTTLKVVKLNSILSKYVNCITYNSKLAYDNHLEFGYKEKKSFIIPNGFELDKFKFSQEKRTKVRKNLNLNEMDKTIITVGRWNVQKDYKTLLLACNELKKDNIEFKLLMVGTNLDKNNVELVNLIKKLDLTDNILLLGKRDDVPSLLSSADLYVSSSIGESFSNAIGEAMATELPCVVTDVGDSRIIVGESGEVVQPKDFKALAKKIENNLSRPYPQRNKIARKRVIDNYEIGSVVKKLEKIYADV